jgi:hypothetical protein
MADTRGSSHRRAAETIGPALGAPALARGAGRLAFDAVEQLTRVVEAMHANIAAAPLPLGRGTDGRARGITGFVYDEIRLVNRVLRAALDGGLGLFARGGAPALPQPRLERWLAVLNGVLGDHLAASGNPLAIPMQLRSAGRALALERDALALPAPRGRLLLLVHGLCMNDRGWQRSGHDHGEVLARELGATPLYLLYNTGRHTSENGRELAELLEALLGAWPAPVEEIAVVAHSMGGLVARSAWHHAAAAGHAWPARLRALVFLGTPHHGAPLERAGSLFDALLGVSPYSAPLARLGGLRSAGITDLRHGNVVEADWQGRDRFAREGDRRAPAPLPEGVACFALAARLARAPRGLPRDLVGDGLVPVASALGRHADRARALAIPEARRFVADGLGHFDLLGHPEVYAKLREWLVPLAHGKPGS